MIDVIIAANYLEIRSLLDAACKIIAKKLEVIECFHKMPLQKNTVEKIREIYQIENDFKPEEEKQIKKENAWIKE